MTELLKEFVVFAPFVGLAVIVFAAVAVLQFRRGRGGQGLFDGCELSVNSRLMSKEQEAIYKTLRGWADRTGHLVATEVAIPAILSLRHRDRSKQQTAWNRLRQKYVDFLILDAACRPLCVVEYQGSGHLRGNAKQRDAVKRAAFDKAGLPFVELRVKASEAQIIEAVEAALSSPQTGARRAAGRSEPPLTRRADRLGNIGEPVPGQQPVEPDSNSLR